MNSKLTGVGSAYEIPDVLWDRIVPLLWVSYWIKGEQDIPDVIELFKMRYDFLKPNTKLVTRTI